MKHFSTNGEVMAAYLDQTHPEGSNYQDSLSFRSKEFYSYNSLLAILDTTNSILLVDKNIRYYSVTTAKQTTLLIRQLPSRFTTYSIDLSTKPEQNLMEYWIEVEELIKKHTRARVIPYTDRIKQKMQEALSYAEYVNVDKRTKAWGYRTNITTKLFELKLL